MAAAIPGRSPRSKATRMRRLRAARLLAHVTARSGHDQPALDVLGGLIEEPDHPGRLAWRPSGGRGRRRPRTGPVSASCRAWCVEPRPSDSWAPSRASSTICVVAPGAAGVVGEGDVVAAVRRAQRVESRLVEPAALPAQQAALDRLAGEVVVEAEDVGVRLHQEAAVDGQAQVVDEVGLRGGRHRRQEVERHAPPEHGGRGHDRAHLGVEARDLVAHELGHRPRERGVLHALGEVPRARHELLEEERVAAGARVERLDGAEGRILLEDGGQERAHLGGAEAGELQVGHRVPTLEAREELGGRMAPGEAVGAVGADHHQGAAFRLGQQLEGGQALGVGPVEVLEHDEAGPRIGEAAHEVDSRPHAVFRGTPAVPDGGEELLVLGHLGVPQGIEEELHRAAHGARIGLAGQHEGARWGTGHQLLDQPGLADPGLAGDQGDGRHGRRAHERAEAAELSGSADHHRGETCAPHEHPGIVRSGRQRDPPHRRCAPAPDRPDPPGAPLGRHRRPGGRGDGPGRGGAAGPRGEGFPGARRRTPSSSRSC